MQQSDIENINIQPNKISYNFHVFLLFIPAIIFVLLLAFIMRINNDNKVAGISSETTTSQETGK